MDTVAIFACLVWLSLLFIFWGVGYAMGIEAGWKNCEVHNQNERAKNND